MQQQQSPWMKGDFHVIGASQTIVGEGLCEDVGMRAGDRVLDIACGSGNTSLAAARRDAQVTGIDLVPALVDRAKARAQSEGFRIEFLTGNAHELPFDDASFDVVLSTFGVMFAPDQERAANEALRVLKPGGRIGFANWTPESMPGALFALIGKYGVAPAVPHPPIAWGTAPRLRELFGGRLSSMRLYDRFVYARHTSSKDFLDRFKRYFGPTIMLYENLPQERHAEADRDAVAIYDRYNRSLDDTFCAALQYVNFVGTKGTA